MIEAEVAGAVAELPESATVHSAASALEDARRERQSAIYPG